MEKYKVIRFGGTRFYSEGEIEELIEEQVKRGWKFVSLSHYSAPAINENFVMVFSKSGK